MHDPELPSPDGPDAAASSLEHSFLVTNIGILYLSVLVSLPFAVVSMMVGLNMAAAMALMVLFVAAIVVIHLRRVRRRPGARLGGTWSVTWSGLLAAIAVFVAIQAVPYGHAMHNPAVVAEPNWPDLETRALAKRACFDCHSNETNYPWYSRVAPASWLIADHVAEARQKLNFSDIGRGSSKPGQAVDLVRQGVMPPFYYSVFGLHRDARLSAAQRQRLIDGLSKMPEFRDLAGTSDQ